MDVQSALRGALPKLIESEQRLRQRAIAMGITYRVAPFGGIRTAADTARLIQWRDEAVARGEPYYRVAPADASKHNVGAAFDLEIVSTPSGMTKSAALAALGKLAPSVGLIWGGTFSAPADPYHFELPGRVVDLAQAYAVVTRGSATERPPPPPPPLSISRLGAVLPIVMAIGVGVVVARALRSQ